MNELIAISKAYVSVIQLWIGEVILMVYTNDVYGLSMVYRDGKPGIDFERVVKLHYTLKITLVSDTDVMEVEQFMYRLCEKNSAIVIAKDRDNNGECYYMLQFKGLGECYRIIKELTNKNKLSMFIAETRHVDNQTGYMVGFRDGKLIQTADSRYVKAVFIQAL